MESYTALPMSGLSDVSHLSPCSMEHPPTSLGQLLSSERLSLMSGQSLVVLKDCRALFEGALPAVFGVPTGTITERGSLDWFTDHSAPQSVLWYRPLISLFYSGNHSAQQRTQRSSL